MKQWLGSRLGANLWELYNSSLKNISIRIDHNLDILEGNQAFSVRFRNIETGQEALVGNSYYFDGDVGSKFYVTSLSPNHFVLELRPHLQDNEYEYIIELLEENDDQSVISVSTGGSSDSLGFGVNYRFDFGDNTITDWSPNNFATHVYNRSGVYKIKSQASAPGMNSFWSEPLTITAYDTSVLVPAPQLLIGDTEVQLGLSVSYKIDEYKEFYGLLEYQVDWADGQISDWTPSSVLLSHVWIEDGIYPVKCQARLASGYKQMSAWSEPLIINVKTQQSMLDLVNAGQFIIDLSPHKTKTPVLGSFPSDVSRESYIGSRMDADGNIITPYVNFGIDIFGNTVTTTTFTTTTHTTTGTTTDTTKTTTGTTRTSTLSTSTSISSTGSTTPGTTLPPYPTETTYTTTTATTLSTASTTQVFPRYTDYATPVMTSNSKPSPYVLTTSSEFDSDHSLYKAFDQNPSTYWSSSTLYDGTCQIEIDFGFGKIINLISFCTTIIGEVFGSPKDFSLEASNDRSYWEELMSGTVPVTLASNGYWTPDFTFENSVPYRYYRLNILSVGDYYYCMLYELRLVAADLSKTTTTTPLPPNTLEYLVVGAGGNGTDRFGGHLCDMPEIPTYNADGGGATIYVAEGYAGGGGGEVLVGQSSFTLGEPIPITIGDNVGDEQLSTTAVHYTANSKPTFREYSANPSVFSNIIARGGSNGGYGYHYVIFDDPSNLSAYRPVRVLGNGGSSGSGKLGAEGVSTYLDKTLGLRAGAGGGGAGGAGQKPKVQFVGGLGGKGIASSITGSRVIYGIGGDGGGNLGGNRIGGTNDLPRDAQDSAMVSGKAYSGGNGAPNTGNGGGGVGGINIQRLGTCYIGNGGSGVVILKVSTNYAATFSGLLHTTSVRPGYAIYSVIAGNGTVTFRPNTSIIVSTPVLNPDGRQNTSVAYATPVMTSAASPSPCIVTAPSAAASYPGYLAFNQNPDNFFQTNDVRTFTVSVKYDQANIVFDFGTLRNAVAVNKYRIFGTPNVGLTSWQLGPTGFILQGSNSLLASAGSGVIRLEEASASMVDGRMIYYSTIYTVDKNKDGWAILDFETIASSYSGYIGDDLSTTTSGGLVGWSRWYTFMNNVPYQKYRLIVGGGWPTRVAEIQLVACTT